jgi:hypothetical protein
MPLTRVLVEEPLRIGRGTYIYPVGFAKVETLEVESFVIGSGILAEFQSAASGVDLATLKNHVLIGFASGFDWEILDRGDHKAHMELLRYLSEVADYKCLDSTFATYLAMTFFAFLNCWYSNGSATNSSRVIAWANDPSAIADLLAG